MYRYGLVFLLSALLLGCAGQTRLGNPELPYPPQAGAEVGKIIHLPTGVETSKSTMLEHAAQARIVYVGETHDSPASHRLQLEILTYLQQRNPGNIALAMEMFTPEQQDVLDRWSAGELTEKEFIKDVHWYQTWQMNFAYYRDLLVFARDNRIPVRGINAPKELVRAVGMTPVDEQPEEIRQRLPELDFTDPYQRAMAKSIYADHPVSDSMKEGFLRIQTLWDESMAENLVNYLESDQGRGKQVMVVAGGNHVRYGFGIPRRAFRRLPLSYLLIGTRTIEIAEDKKVETMNVKMPGFPMPPYHFIEYTRYENLPAQGVKLGVHLKQENENVMIVSVLPGSAADQAGLRSNDILRKIDDTEIKETFDLIYELNRLKKEDLALLSVERNGEIQQIRVDFSKAEPHHPN